MSEHRVVATIGAAPIVAALRDVIDPDLGINVVDLGFVNRVTVEHDTADLEMTLTSPACPLTKIIEDQIRTAIVDAGLVRSFAVSWVWSPAWTPARVSADGRDQLRAVGFSL
jgi:metal-sulfur cluster biosynthetic enzyme